MEKVFVFGVKSWFIQGGTFKNIGWCPESEKPKVQKELQRLASGASYTLTTIPLQLEEPSGEHDLVCFAVDTRSGSIWCPTWDYQKAADFATKEQICVDCCRKLSVDELSSMQRAPKYAWD